MLSNLSFGIGIVKYPDGTCKEMSKICWKYLKPEGHEYPDFSKKYFLKAQDLRPGDIVDLGEESQGKVIITDHLENGSAQAMLFLSEEEAKRNSNNIPIIPMTILKDTICHIIGSLTVGIK